MTVLLCSLRFQYIPENQITQHPWMPVFVWQSNSSHPFSSSHRPGKAPPSACNALPTAHREALPFKGKEARGALEMAHGMFLLSLLRSVTMRRSSNLNRGERQTILICRMSAVLYIWQG